jgi:two-component system, NarL family, response regulator LiaR
MTDRIRVLIADDHRVVRDGLRVFLGSSPQIEVVGEARDGLEAVAQAGALHPEIILMDLLMPGMDGIEATRLICRDEPTSRVIVLTSSSEDEKVIAAVRAGAVGYLMKDSTPQELRDAILAVRQGGSVLPPRIAVKVIQELKRPADPPQSHESHLTEREKEILRLVAHGQTNQEIADHLSISVWTVRSHLTSILAKLNLENRTQATLFAIHEGLVQLEACFPAPSITH